MQQLRRARLAPIPLVWALGRGDFARTQLTVTASDICMATYTLAEIPANAALAKTSDLGVTRVSAQRDRAAVSLNDLAIESDAPEARSSPSPKLVA